MEELIILSQNKEDIYNEIIPQVISIVEDESDKVANMANVAAILKEAFGFFWVGFYIVKDSSNGRELVLGPFQGPLACTRIKFGKGVCGSAWKEAKTLIVPDVEQFPGHIACSSASKSEIVVPVFHGDMVVAVLDVDSAELNMFDDIDAKYLEILLSKIYDKI